MNNPFQFYTTTEEDREKNKRATKEIIKEFENFKSKIREIINKYREIGATDTQSREEIVNYFKKELNEGGFI